MDPTPRQLGHPHHRRPRLPLTPPPRPRPRAEAAIASWHADGLARYATTVTTARGVIALVTHAGVTKEWWETELDGDTDPHAAAGLINSLDLEATHREGKMLGVDYQWAGLGPVWASTAELWSGWLDIGSPFPQVHGHRSAWRHDRWAPTAPNDCRPYATRNRQRRHTRYVTGRGAGHVLVGIDCGIGPSPRQLLTALVVPHARSGRPDIIVTRQESEAAHLRSPSRGLV